MIPNNKFFILFVALFHFVLGVHVANAETNSSDASSTATLSSVPIKPNPLRIGFLRPEGETDLTEESMEGLRKALLADNALQQAATRAYDARGIGLYEIDGGTEMLSRLNARELDVAFVPSRIWAEQSAGYTVILQTRRKRDFTATRGRMVWQRGVVFVSSRSPFFDSETIDSSDFATYLGEQRIAVVSSKSMAGYVAPLLALSDEYNRSYPAADLLWCESSAEVTKAVISGLADVGTCEEGAMIETLNASGISDRQQEFTRVILRSSPVPTDPVVVHPDLAPSRSELGRELKRVLRSYSLETGFGTMSLQDAQDSDYEETRALLRRFDDRLGKSLR